ncbi:MAG: hypothetical protein CVU39_23565 [Chloroflexi bacterium HGW-Chloroflexi-10]|nr:MAG: hypothetical protein CVU39_23565 [Chloroflexi bacterium HGW-Chloroflexi-10]
MDQYAVFFLLSILAAVVMLAFAVYVFPMRHTRIALSFLVLLIAIALWTASIGFGLLAGTHEAGYIWAVLRMAGVFAVPVIWFDFSFHFADRASWLRPMNLVWLSIIPLVSFLLMASNNAHHLFLKNILWVQHGPFLVDETWILGPWFWVHIVYSYGLILAGDVVLIRAALQLPAPYKRQIVALVAGAIVPLCVNLSYTFHLIPGITVNYDPFGFVVAGAAFSFALFSYRLFDIRPIAKRLILDGFTDVLFVIDEKFRIVDLNPAAENHLNISKDQIIGNPFTGYMADFSFEAGKSTCVEYCPPERDQSCFDVSVSPIVYQKRCQGHLLVMRDITERKAMEEKLKLLSVTDGLTGLINRRQFLSLGELEIERSIRNQHSLAIAFLDINNFKYINDQHGHLVGDLILKQVADFIQEQVRSIDVLARFGGDEFVILFPEMTADRLPLILERLQTSFTEKKFRVNKNSFALTVSCGSAIFDPADPILLHILIDQADQDMYQNKLGIKASG